MATTLTIISGQTSFTAQGYKILPSPGTAVPDNLAQAIISAAVTAGVVLSSSAGTGVVTVPSRRFSRDGVGPPQSGEGLWLLGDEIVDSAASEWECTAPGDPGTWLAVASGTYASPGSVLSDVTSVRTTAGALTVGQHNPVDATTAGVSVSIPSLSTAGQRISVEKTDSSLNAVTVTLNLRGTPASTLTLVWKNETLELVSKADGSWWPTAGHKTKASIDAEIVALGTGTFAAVDKLGVRPEDHGVVGNGVADDTAALQAFYNGAGAGKRTYLAGSYKISDVVNVTTAGTSLVGPGTITQVTNLKSAVYVKASGCTVEGLTIVGTNTGDATTSFPTNANSYGAGVIFQQVTSGWARNLTLVNCSDSSAGVGAAIYLSGAAGVHVTDCQISGGGTAINTDAYFGLSGGNYIRGCSFTGMVRGYVSDFGGSGQATAGNSGDLVSDCFALSVSGVAFQADRLLHEGTFSNCRAISCGTGFSLAHNVAKITLTGCIARKGTLGLVISGVDASVPTQINIVGGSYSDNTQDGVQLYTTRRVTFSGVGITGNTRHGVYQVSGNFSRQIKFLGCQVQGNGQHGFNLNDPVSYKILGCSIHGNGTAASNTYNGVTINGVNITPNDILIDGCDLYDINAGGTDTQAWALLTSGTVGSAVRERNNYFGTYGTGLVSGSVERGSGNRLVAVTGNYTALIDDSTIVVNASSAPTITLPAPGNGSGVGPGKTYTIKNRQVNATVQAASGNIDGASTITVLQGDSVVVVSDGNQYWIASRKLRTGMNTRLATTLASAGTVAMDTTSASTFWNTLNANATSSSLTSATNGASVTIVWIQDATGGRTYVWPTTCKFAGNSAPSDTTLNTQTSVTFEYDGTTWHERARSVAVPT